MRIANLVEKELPADYILKEIGVSKDERQVILEFLPLIPVALWAGGAAWTAYDTYRAKKQLDNGEITQAEFAARVGTDVALTVAGGVLGKVVSKGFKVGKTIYKSKKAAKLAQKKTADIPTPKNITVPKGVNKVTNAPAIASAATTTTKATTKKVVQKANPGDTITTKKGKFIAGVDGKATTTRIDSPHAAKIKKKILDLSTPKYATGMHPNSVNTRIKKGWNKISDPIPAATSTATDATAKVASKATSKATSKKVKDVMPHSITAPATSTAAKATTKATSKKVKDVMPHSTAPAATSTATKATTKTVDKLKGKVDDKLQKAADDAAHKKNVANIKRNQKINKQGEYAPATTSLVAKKVGSNQIKKNLKKTDVSHHAGAASSKLVAKKVANKKLKKNKNKDKKKDKKKSKLKSYWSNLNKGNYWDSNLLGVAQKYGFK